MNSGSALSISAEKQRLELLSKAVRFISCGKLKRGSQLLAEATRQGDSEDMQNLNNECRSLGFLVQARRCLRKADDFLMAGAFEESLECYNKVPSAVIPAELSFQILHNKGVCLVRLERYFEAVQCLQAARVLIPGNSVALQNLAFALMLTHEYEAALAVFVEVIRNDDIPPTSLLHVLYGSAACRQRLQGSVEPTPDQEAGIAGGTVLSADSDPLSDDDSYNDYPLGQTFGHNLQNVAHHQEVHNGSQVAAHATTIEGGNPQELAKTFVPFRRLQYRAVTSDVKSAPPKEPIFIPSLPEILESKSTTIGSPSAVLSREKREQLRRAVNSYDRSALPSASTDAGLVSAQMHTLPPRLRSTDPSPGHAAQLSQPHAANAAVPLDAQQFRNHGSVISTAIDRAIATTGDNKVNIHPIAPRDAAESVSSAKPALSSHRRRPTYFDFKLAAVPSAPSSPRSTTQSESTRTVGSRPAMFASAAAAPLNVLTNTVPLPKMQRRSASQDLQALGEPTFTALVDSGTVQVLPPSSMLLNVERKPLVAESIVRTVEGGGAPALPQKVEVSNHPHLSSHVTASKPARKQSLLHSTTSDDEVKSQTHLVAEVESAQRQTPVAEPASVALVPEQLIAQVVPVVAYNQEDRGQGSTANTDAALTLSVPSDVHVSAKPPRAARPVDHSPGELVAFDVGSLSTSQPARASFAHSTVSDDSSPFVSVLALIASQPAGVLHGPSEETAASSAPIRHTADVPPWVGEEPADMSATAAAPYNSLCQSSNTSISGISGDSCLNSSMISSYLRGNEAYIHHTSLNSEVSEQQQEINRVFESRRYVDEYTFTSLDVMRLRSEQASTASTPPTTVAQFYPLAALQTPGPFSSDVDVRFREYYLSDEEFRSLFRCSKAAWENIPPWRQRNLKKAFKLF